MTDHHNKYNNNEKCEVLRRLPKCDMQTQSKQLLKNSANKLVRARVATELQFVYKKKAIKAHNILKS